MILSLFFYVMAAHASHTFTGIDLASATESTLKVGREVTFVRENKQTTVVVFLSAKCPCSHSHIVELKALTREFADVRFIGIHSNSDESETLARTYFKELNLPFPVLQDEGAKYADEFKAAKTPHAFVLSPQGDVLFQGGVSSSARSDQADRHYLREALLDVKANRDIRTPRARALGCAITRPR